MDSINTVFGKNVKKYREQREWTQAYLAEKVDISTAFMTHIERGTRGVSMETVELFAKTFGVNYADLFKANEENTDKALKAEIAYGIKNQIINSLSTSIDDYISTISKEN